MRDGCDIAPWRLHLLRGGYLLVAAGLGLVIWPELLDPAAHWSPSRGIVVCMLAALSLCCVAGLRHPVRMLPVLYWEIGWKTLWLCRVALPAFIGGRMDAATQATSLDCLPLVIVIAVIPWNAVLNKRG